MRIDLHEGEFLSADIEAIVRKISPISEETKWYWMKPDWQGWGGSNFLSFMIAWVRLRLCLLVKCKHILGRLKQFDFFPDDIKMCQLLFIFS